MKCVGSSPEESSEAVARRYYCVCGPDGEESPEKLARAAQAIHDANARRQHDAADLELPEVRGVPFLEKRVEDVADIAAVIREYMPRVESDPRLLALSFVHPLRLATDELGIAVSPRVARHLRRTLHGIVSFSMREVDEQGSLPGIDRIRWTLRPERSAGNT